MSRNKGLLALLLTSSLLFTACQTGEQEQAVISEKLITPTVANYKTVTVEVGDYEKSGQGGATLEFPIYENLSVETNGVRFQETCVTIGDMVNKGDVLAIFQTDDMEVEMEELKLGLQRAKEQLEEGKANRKTAIAKAEEKLEDTSRPHQYRIAQINIEKQWIDYEQFIYQSEKEIESIEEQIAELEEKVEDCTLIAPFDGMIEDVTVFREGEIVNAGETVISMFSFDTVLIKTDDMAKNPAYNVPVTLEAGAKKSKITATGRVISAPNILPYTVKQDYSLIVLEDEDLDIAGLYDTFRDRIQQRIMCYYTAEQLQDILLVDKRAVTREGNSSYVYILDGDTVQKRFVVTGLSSNDNIWILDGLSEGQTLILD